MESSKLKEVLDQHQLWIESAGKHGQRAYLTGADLAHRQLAVANLAVANLEGANLEGASLYRANLSGANLTGANLTGANLTVANLAVANLEGAYFEGANLTDANLEGANLTGANLTGANLTGANLTNTILPDISWIIPGCLAQLNQFAYDFYLEKDRKYENFIQDSFGFIVQNNLEENSFDMLLGDRIFRNIPDWVKYSGLRQFATESV
jgi:hypothetical protein